MKLFSKLFSVIFLAVVFSSCSKGGDPNSLSRIKFDAKPQVKDILKGKSKSEVLKMKFSKLMAICTLETQKITRSEFVSESLESAPTTPPITDSPITYLNENTVIFDLKLQQQVDRELVKEVMTKLTSAKDGQTLKIDISFKPISFQESLNLDFNKKKFIMKHTPVLSFSADYQLIHSNTSTIVGKTQSKIYEKIEGQTNEIIAIEIGADKYNFVLDCRIDRAINAENPSHATEFNNQWAEIDCLAPKNEEERTLCK